MTRHEPTPGCPPRGLRATALVAALASLGSGCLTYDQRICDDPDPHACDPRAVNPPQQLRDFRRPDRATRPPLNSPADVRSVVVTAVDDYLEGTRGNTGDIWVQQIVTDPGFTGCAPYPGGGRVCGMQLFSPSFVPAGQRPLTGDLVNVGGGVYQEFDCTPCCAPPRPPCLFADGRTLPELSQTSVERVGSARVPDAVPVTLAEIVAAGDAYMGVLVRLTDVVTTAAIDTRGEVDIGMGVKLTGQLTPLLDPGAPAGAPRPLAAGTRLANLTGIVSYFYGAKLIPRSAADFQLAP